MTDGRRSTTGGARLSTGVVHTVEELHACHYRPATIGERLPDYFQSVAIPNAAAIPPMPMRMFQLPRAAMNGIW